MGKNRNNRKKINKEIEMNNVDSKQKKSLVCSVYLTKPKLTRGHKILIFILILIYPYIINLQYFPKDNPLLSIRTANYKYTYEILLNIDKLGLQDSKLACTIRNNLFNQYLNLYNSFSSNVYNALGNFYYINQEFIKYKEKHSNENKNSINEYNNYKQKYINELHKVLIEYKDREKSLEYFLDVNGATRKYKIPNRLALYPYLASTYIAFADSEYNINLLNDYRYILLSYDDIWLFEENTNSRQYRSFFGKTRYQKMFQSSIGTFLGNFSSNIIKMDYQYNKVTFCENKEIFDRYELAVKSGFEENKEITTLLKKECNYIVNSP